MPLVASPPMKSPMAANTGKKVVRPASRPGIGAPSLITFGMLFAAHALAAAYAPIQDCDEVFNFWEPAHYLNHGHGLQTWELSPVYAIRSWLYVSLHAAVAAVVSAPLSALFRAADKRVEFFAVRFALAALTAACETRLFNRLARCVNPRVAVFYLVAAATSAGGFIASASFLPSSFGMCTVALALSEFVDWRSGVRTAPGLMWLALGTIVGWPFIAVLCFPFVLEDVATALLVGDVVGCVWRLADGLARSLVILAIEVAVDSFFFQKLSVVPLNIVLYNVFAGPGKGPDIYGTEPWHFYGLNLLLNFNIWFVLALGAIPLLFIYHIVRGQGPTRLGWVRSTVMASPFYLWLGIMTAQPHKEERFMYPIFPCIAMNAAISLHVVALALGSPNKQSLVGAIPARLRLMAVSAVVLAAVSLGIWRSAGLATAYGAPLTLYKHIQNHTDVGASNPIENVNVCVGKEWYRFPSSYHLPAGFRLKFITSNFHGLLPGEFAEAPDGASRDVWDPFPAAHIVAPGMNDENIEDEGKYTPITACDYLVDSHFEGAVEDNAEPAFVTQAETRTGEWETVACESFLDAAGSGALGRMGWVPDVVARRTDIPGVLQRRWGQYCLLHRRANASLDAEPRQE